MHLLVIPWDVNPEIFRIGTFAVRWYGLLFVSGFLFSYIIMNKIFQNENLGKAVLDGLTIYMVIGVIVGMRLGHCLFYEPGYYLRHPAEILMIWHGGLASHGGAIGILIALWLFKRKEKKDYFWILDRIAIVAAWRKKGEHYQGMLVSLVCILVFTSRFFIEFVKGDQVAFEAAMKLKMGQWLSIPFIIMGIVGLYLSLKYKKRAIIIRQ